MLKGVLVQNNKPTYCTPRPWVTGTIIFVFHCFSMFQIVAVYFDFWLVALVGLECRTKFQNMVKVYIFNNGALYIKRGKKYGNIAQWVWIMSPPILPHLGIAPFRHCPILTSFWTSRYFPLDIAPSYSHINEVDWRILGILFFIDLC